MQLSGGVSEAIYSRTSTRYIELCVRLCKTKNVHSCVCVAL